MILADHQKDTGVALFKSVQDILGQVTEDIDRKTNIKPQYLTREASGPLKAGGQTIGGIIRSEIVEKYAANFTATSGGNCPAIGSERKGKPFIATGVSTICHMNVRSIDVGDTFGFGGGGNLTPFLEYKDDTEQIHEVLRDTCKSRVDREFSKEQKDQQLYGRGRYADFNLLWDRGTKFGLMSEGNTEAILVSMPPVVKW